MFRKTGYRVISVAAGALAATSALGQVPLERIALTGDLLQPFNRPGEAGYSPILLGPFHSASGNAAGQVAFTVDAAAPEGRSRDDVYIGLFTGSSLDTIAYEYLNNPVSVPLIDSAGHVVVPPSEGRDWRPGSRRMVGNTGVFQSGIRANMSYRAFEINTRNEVLFPVSFQAPYLEGALYLNTGSVDVPIARNGQSAVGFPGDVVYEYFVSGLGFGNQIFKPYRIGPGGHVVFVSPVRGPGVSDDLEDYGSVWLAQPNVSSIALVARIGDVPPGVSDGGRFERFIDVQLGPNGELALLADVSGDRTAEPFVYRGVWASTTGVLRRVTTNLDLFAPTQATVVYDLRIGYSPEGTLLGVYRGVPEPLRRDETLDVLAEAIYYGPLDGLQLAPLAEVGGPAAGGGVFSDFHEYSLVDNAQGVLLNARFDVDDGTLNRKQGNGLWLGVPGSVLAIVRESDRVPVSAGDTRTVTSAHLIGAHEGQARSDLFLNLAFAPQLGVLDTTFGLYRAALPRLTASVLPDVDDTPDKTDVVPPPDNTVPPVDQNRGPSAADSDLAGTGALCPASSLAMVGLATLCLVGGRNRKHG